MVSSNDYNQYANGYMNGIGNHRKEVEILLIEDNPDHVEITTTALENTGILSSRIHVSYDGEEALSYIYNPSIQRPDLILLDIRLPKIDGLEVLKKIKTDPRLQTIPVIILTTSSEEGDIIKGYKYGANSYVTKPVNFKDFISKIKSIKFYWIFTNTLPIS